MDGYGSGCVAGFGVGIGIDVQTQGGPDIMGSGWCSHTLNALAEYRSRRCCSSLPLFASVAGKERLVGLGGGGALVGHEQVLGGGGFPPLWFAHPRDVVFGSRGSVGLFRRS